MVDTVGRLCAWTLTLLRDQTPSSTDNAIQRPRTQRVGKTAALHPSVAAEYEQAAEATKAVQQTQTSFIGLDETRC